VQIRGTILFLLLSVSAFAQGGFYQDRAEGRLINGNALVAIPGAAVTVCSDQACASPVTIYSDAALTQSIGTSTTADANGNFSFYVRSGQYFCQVAASGFSTSINPCQVSVALPNVAFVGGGTADIGAQINAAYAAFPANGGTIIVMPKSDNSCYVFTTPIVANVSGKYLLLEGWLAGGSAAGCLNYTPTSGSAITLDFVPASGAGARGGVYGIRDLWLTNNLCTSIGGCGGSTTGVTVTSTNDGIDGGMMENVTIQGFTVGYGENARVPSSAVQWINPRIYNNGIGMNLFATAEEQIVGGTFYGNGNHIQSGDTNSQPEIHITGTYFIAHSNEAFSFTNTTLGGTIYLTDVHLENGANSTINAHYVEGNVSIFGKGGVAEDDSSGGTADWWFNPSGLAFMWDGLEIVTASRNPSIGVLDLAGNTRAKLTGFIINPATLTSIVGGANAAKATVCMLSGDITHTASTCAMEAPLQTPSLQLNGTTVSSLPSAASNAGKTMYVTDSTTVSAEGQTCVGSSTNKALAFSNGTVWKCF
jgi:hypothetical protein